MSTIIMIGNPGTGKSTLLSSLVKEPVFASGVAIGKGKTSELQSVERDGNTYIDTPGLSDVKLREKAAAAIEEAFTKGGKFKVFFVVTLESGRVKPDDVATIKLVLDAITQIGDNEYSILINKMTIQVEKLLNNSEVDREELATCFAPISLRVATKSIFYVPMSPSWVDQANVCGELSPQLLSFISNAPGVTISKEHIYSIQFRQFERIIEELWAEIRALQEDNAVLKRAMEERERRVGKLQWTDNPSYATATHDTPSGPVCTRPVRTESYNAQSTRANPKDTLGRQRAKSAFFSSPVIPGCTTDMVHFSYIFIGNRGTGKSTLINCLSSGRAGFESSSLLGDTQSYQCWQSDSGVQFVEATGLADKSTREDAAVDIVEALKFGHGRFKVFFVLVLESGRVRPDDKATMKLVLDAAPQIESKYSIIVNKTTEIPHDKQSKPLRRSLTKGISKKKTKQIYYYPNDPRLSAQDNAMIALESGVVDFIYNKDNAVEITPSKVQHIDTDTYIDTQRKMERIEWELNPVKITLKPPPKNTIVMIGNPGVGKSSLLTSLVDGQYPFHSGISFGQGLTASLQEVDYMGTMYVDVPGLSGEKAAAEIAHLLEYKRMFKIFFVVTLESRKVRPEDATLIQQVLTAATQIKSNQFSIIFNKLSPEELGVLRDSKGTRDALADILMPASLHAHTNSVFCVSSNPLWVGRDNMWGKLDAELLKFIKNAPSFSR